MEINITCIFVLPSFFIPFALCFQNCVVGEWHQWGDCNSKCSIGQRYRNREILVHPIGIFGKPCPQLTESIQCGKKSECEVLCDEKTGRCLCQSGHKLAIDNKSCEDINECAYNNNLGSCSQRCINLNGGYKCSCFNGFKLSPNRHDCTYDGSSEICKQPRHFDEQGNCVCKNKLDGLKCDRNASLCRNSYLCADNDICLTFTFAPKRCINEMFLLPVLLPIPYSAFIMGDIPYNIENNIENFLEGNYNGKLLINMNRNSLRHRRDLLKAVYVEGSNPKKVKSSHTYVRFAVFDVKNNFVEIEARKLCHLLDKNDIKCLNQTDCNLLRSTGIVCPSISFTSDDISRISDSNSSPNNAKNTGTKPWIYILITGTVVAVVFILLYFVIKKFVLRMNSNRERFLDNGTSNMTVKVEQHSNLKHQNLDETNELYGIDDTMSDHIYSTIN